MPDNALEEALAAAGDSTEVESGRAPVAIDNDLRTLRVPSNYVFGVYNDKDVLSVPFKMPRYYDGVDLSSFVIRINYVNAAGISSIYEVNEKSIDETEIAFNWLLGAGVFTQAGSVTFSVCLREANNETGRIVREFNTTKAEAVVLPGLEVEDINDPTQYSILIRMENYRDIAQRSAEIAEDAADRAAVSEQTARLYLGAPLKATTISEMTDNTRVYVYVGNEEGYEFGHWYYNDGFNWVEGGAYNATAQNTDTTLTVSGVSADSKAAGDAIRNLTQRSDEADNQISTIDAKVSELEAALDNVTIDPNDLGLYQNPDTFYVYPTYRDVVSENGIPLASSGGGGGGGEVIDAKFTAEKLTDWNVKTVPDGDTIKVYFRWSSLENEVSTGDGSVRITNNGVVRSSYQVPQGDLTVDLTPYIQNGTNKVVVRISDVYDQAKSYAFTVNSTVLDISVLLDTSNPFYGDISVPYVPIGSVQKTVHFILDGTEIGTQQTAVSNKQVSYTIPAQSHGTHKLKVYFDCTINNELVKSKEVYCEFMSAEVGNTETMISSSYNDFEIEQYVSAVVPFRVFSPNSATTDISIYVGETLVSTQTVDRTEQRYTFRSNEVGNVTLKIVANGTEKEFPFVVSESMVDVTPETEGLALHLTAQGRSNNEENPAIWTNNGVSAVFTDFTFNRDGWQKDSDGIDVLRTVGDARLLIPYNVFAKDLKQTGFTFEIEFSTREVFDYSAQIISCFADNIGFKITPQMITFRGAQTETSTLYKDNEHIRLGIVVSKQTEYRLILIYINGVASRAIQYASGERFSQPNPVGISIGSNNCGIDLYTIRVYNQNLSMQQMLENFIADTPVGSIMLERYLRNNVYNEYGEITKELLPSYLPYMIIECEELPQYKGDKKTASGSFTNPLLPSKSFTFTGCQINVQGTSSSVYYIKNIDMQFKEGFVTSKGTIDNYALREGSIPFNRFVLKADVASSESYNNTGLSMFFNDLCPWKNDEMRENPKVRHGIEGIPIAMFWYNPTTAETKFMGKYNFNLPKRAPAPLGYHDNMQSWEWERNNSDNVKFKDDDFTSTSWDEVKQEYYPTWYDDFEARMPSDEWRDYTMLKEMISWVKSTDRSQATNEDLTEEVVYKLSTTITVNNYPDDISYTVEDEIVEGEATGNKIFTFTKDTQAYRLTKFRAEFADRFEVDSAVFYYIFTEFFLMIDSRAKNMFIGFKGSPVTIEGSSIDRKAAFEIYDADTAIGTNNSGVLMFDYTLEDTDTVSGVISGDTSGSSDAPVFNAQDSVLWVNLRDSFRSEITVMYRNLRAGGLFNYKTLEARYEEHQSKWGEAIANEDAEVKYLTPLTNPVTVDETTGELIRTDRYLTMLQGFKTEQRKWWLSNRFKYMDSKYVTGEAASSTISMRLFNSGTLTITSAIDLYAGVSFGGGTTVSLVRTNANTPVDFTYVAPSGVTEMETWIYSAGVITGVGDLSVFYPNELDFSKAVRLKSLKIGAGTEGYSNANMKVLDVRNCALLESIDVRNCPNLAITVDLENSPRLESALFEGTAITGIELTDGGAIETLHLPGTITTLTLLNLSKLSDFVLPDYSNISRLMLANIDPEIVDPVAILSEVTAGSQVNIQNLALEMTSSEEIGNFLDLLDTMIGVSREKNSDGEWIYHEYETAQVSGRIHTEALTAAEKAVFNARYPYLTIEADFTTSYLTFKSWDDTLIKSVICYNGAPQEEAPSVPARADSSDGHYSYTAEGWNTDISAEVADPTCITNVTTDRTVYAVYSKTVKTYTVTWKNGNSTIRTDSNVAWGTKVAWGQAMPTNTDGQTAIGWDYDLTQPITGNTTISAKYKPMYTITFVRASADGGGTLQTSRVEEGSMPAYTGSTPTTTQGDAADYPFEGWTPTIVAATANTTYTAKFGSPIEVTEITDSWDTIIANIDNGTYSTKYKVGNYKPLTVVDNDGAETSVNMQIVAFDTDIDVNGNNIPITFITKEFVDNSYRLITPLTVPNAIVNLIPSSISTRIPLTIKDYYDRSSDSIKSVQLKYWRPSGQEIGLTNSKFQNENNAKKYAVFSDANSRIKRNSSGASNNWGLRSSHPTSSNPAMINASGALANSTSANVVFGFCLGLEPETITDDWATILANENYATDYAIGDTKYVDFGSYGKHLMEIVAFDADEKADGSGNAKITWLEKDLLTTNRYTTNYNQGTNWVSGSIRGWLSGTVLPKIQEDVRNGIVAVNKTYHAAYPNNTTETSQDALWIPSIRELGGRKGQTQETSGPIYSSTFTSNTVASIKKLNGVATQYYTRSNYENVSTNYHIISDTGNKFNSDSRTNRGIALGFCTD